MQEKFIKLSTELIGLSIDCVFSHISWLKSIEEKIEYKQMKNIEIKFPVIADLKMEVTKKYGMVQPDASTTQAVRALFVLIQNTK
jgi:peroxiredoxin (alkyl hydroperoxide reductase subunit C)